MIQILPVLDGFKYVQTLPRFDLTASSSVWSASRQRVNHYADWILTDLVDNGGGSYTATGGNLYDLYGAAYFENGGDIIGGASNVCFDKDVPIIDKVVSCYVPKIFSLNVVTNITFNTNDFSITVTKNTVDFAPCSNVNNSGVFTEITLENAPDTSQITNLVIAPRCGRFISNSGFTLTPFLRALSTNSYNSNEGFYDPAVGYFRWPSTHTYHFPAYISRVPCVMFPNGKSEIENWLADYYQQAQAGTAYWGGDIGGLVRCGAPLIWD